MEVAASVRSMIVCAKLFLEQIHLLLSLTWWRKNGHKLLVNISRDSVSRMTHYGLKCLVRKTCPREFSEPVKIEKIQLNFLALLSRRLTGELLVYPCSIVIVVVVVVVVHTFQASSPLKPLGQSKPNFMWSILRKGERKFVYKWSRSHDQDGRHGYK